MVSDAVDETFTGLKKHKVIYNVHGFIFHYFLS